MRPLFLFSLLLFSSYCYAQDSTSKIFIKELKWSIPIPENFELLEDSIQKKLNETGAKLMEEANDVKIPIGETKNLFSAMNGNNILYSTISPFSEKKGSSYSEANKKMREMIYKTFIEKAPQAQLDSSSSTVTIDYLSFEKFTIKASLNKRPLFTMCILYKLYKGFDFGITYLYLSEWAQNAIEKAIFQSKFTK